MPAGWIAGGATLLGAFMGADATRSAANKAADATKFEPWNVYSGYGSGTFTPASAGSGGHWSGGGGGGFAWSGDRGGPNVSGGINPWGGGYGQGTWIPGTPATPASATATLSPEYQALRDQYMQQAGGQLGAMGAFDPNQASRDMYDKLASLSEPTEARARTDLESRLLAQGMLGSTGGGIQQQSLFDSQGQSRIARELQSWTTAQDTLNQMQGRAINATNAASGLDALPLQNLNLGGVLGGRQSAANGFGAGLQFQAAQNKGDSIASFWSGLGQQVAPAISNYANTWRSPYTQNQANDFYGSLYTGMPSGGGGAFNYSMGG